MYMLDPTSDLNDHPKWLILVRNEMVKCGVLIHRGAFDKYFCPPLAWLNEAYRSLWLKELESHEFHIRQRRNSQTNIINTTSNLAQITSIRRIPGSPPSHSTPPSSTPTEASEDFWRCCERYGRIIEDPRGSRGWRWTGYCFGVDLMFQFRRR